MHLSAVAVVPAKNFSMHESNLLSWFPECVANGIKLVLIIDSLDKNDIDAAHRVSKRYSNVIAKVIVGDFQSPGAARNQGLGQIDSYDWVMFWDIDDVPNIASIAETLAATDSVSKMIIGRYAVIDSTTHAEIEESRFWKKQSGNLIKVAINPGLWRWVFPSNMIQSLRFTDYKFGEDQCFIFDALVKNPDLAFSENIFYNYTINVAQQLTSNPKNSSELLKSISYISKKLPNASYKLRNLGIIMITRQALTLTKRHKYISKKLVRRVWMLWFGAIRLYVFGVR